MKDMITTTPRDRETTKQWIMSKRVIHIIIKNSPNRRENDMVGNAKRKKPIHTKRIISSFGK